MPTYKAYVRWEVSGIMEVEAENETKAYELFDEMPLPTENYYLDDSFHIDEIELVEE